MAWMEGEAKWRPVTEAGFDHGRFVIYVWRWARTDGGTQTEKSRRALELSG
jgi:hypothetical protein